MYSTLLFDLDHTLFDTDASERAAYEATMRGAGVDRPERYFATYSRINTALWAAVERRELTPQEVRLTRFQQFAAETGIDADPEAMALAFVTGLGELGGLYDGALEVLEVLAGRARLALVTNGLSEVQRTRVERLGIAAFFSAIVISAEVGTAKPAASMFDVTFDRLGTPVPNKAATLMVGDSLSADIRGGADYGLATCWYNPHGKPADPAIRVDHEIAALTELLAIG